MTLRAYLKVKRGRTTLLAKALGVSVAIVSMWANKQRRIPAEQCGQISLITGVPMRSLRRDLFGKS
jgi:DNA-binding transcriptional regulator YdaS (Cro superfamily)